jgi:alpha-ribazole phosphatase/probable phosphoglycerate mutase
MSGGRTDTALSLLGEEQAALLAERVAPEFSYVHVYSSPLRRAVDTVKALAAAARSPVLARPGLREIDCGGLEGVAISEVKQRCPREWEQNLRQDDDEFRWPGGESYSEFRRRCLGEVRLIAAAHRGGCALLVTHAGVISQIVGAIPGLSAARWDRFRPGNASITELSWGPRSGQVVRFDDRSHLTPTSGSARFVMSHATTHPRAG